MSIFPILDILDELHVVRMPYRDISRSQNIDQELSLSNCVYRHSWFSSDLWLQLPLESESCLKSCQKRPIWSQLDLIYDRVILYLFTTANIILCLLSSGIDLFINLLPSLESSYIKQPIICNISGANICCIGFFSCLFLI